MRSVFVTAGRFCVYGFAVVGILSLALVGAMVGPLREDFADAATLVRARLVLRALGEEHKVGLETEQVIDELRYALYQDVSWRRFDHLPLAYGRPAPAPAPLPKTFDESEPEVFDF